MHSHYLIFAILSLRALAGIHLTAHEPNDWKCIKPPIGNQVDLAHKGCVVYQPEQPDAYISIEWSTNQIEAIHNVSIFSDLNCKDNIGSLSPNLNETSGNPDCTPTCIGMSLIAGPWGSAKRGPDYVGP